MERQLEYERRQKEKELGIEKTYDAEEPKDTVMVYQWQTGDIVHIGATDYEIIEDGDPIVLQDKEFPLFIENFSKEQLLQLLKENPLNDSLLVGVPVNAEQEIKQQAETITDEYATDPKRKLYEQFSLFADSILHHDNNSRTSYLNREVRLFSNLQLKQNLIGAITVISLYMAPFSIYMNAELEV